MAKSQKKTGRETRKPKNEQASGKKVPQYLREGGDAHVVIPDFKPSKKGSSAS